MRHSRSGIFLMELIVCLLFFSIASAVCVQLFVKAQMLNQESVQLGEACAIAENIVEEYKDQNSLTAEDLYFLESGKPCDPQEAVYHARAEVKDQILQIEVYCEDQKVYAMDYYHHIRKEWKGMAEDEE